MATESPEDPRQSDETGDNEFERLETESDWTD